MMKKLLTLSLLLATASALADIDLTVNVVKIDGSVVTETVKFNSDNAQYEIDDMLFEVSTRSLDNNEIESDEDASRAMLNLKISRKNEQGEWFALCNAKGKIELNKEQVLEIVERTEDESVVQTMTLTFFAI